MNKPASSRHKPDVDQGGEIPTLPIFILFGVFFILYLLGSIFPDSFLWGVHQLAFIPVTARALLFVLALLFALANKQYIPALASLLIPGSTLRARHYLVLGITGIGAGILFYTLRISIDMYGDSRTLLSLIGGKQFTLADIFNFSDNEPLARLLHQTIAHMFGLELGTAFQLVSAICGGVLVVMYTWFVVTLEGPKVWKLFLLILGLTGGVNQLFFGHVEDYTVAYAWLILLMILAWRSFEGKGGIALMVIVFLLGTRLHIEMALCLPAVVYAILHDRKKTNGALPIAIAPKNIMRFVGASLVAGLVLYVGYFRAYAYASGDQEEKLRKIFLPLFNYLPAPHVYTLFSVNHISDIVQEILLIVAPGALILVAVAVLRHRMVRWAHPGIIFYGLTSFYFLLFDFTVDPALSPPRDWDLLSLAAAPLLFFAAAISAQWLTSQKSEAAWKAVAGCALGLAVLSSTIFYVNAREDAAATRLRSLGVWVFKSYYLGSTYMVNVAHKLLSSGQQEILEREETIRELEPYASAHDLELGFLVHKVAALHFAKKDYVRAKESYLKALGHDSTNASAWRYLALASLLSGDLSEADRRITVYNANINVPDVIDFGGLQIAAYVQHCSQLSHAGADSVTLNRALEAASSSFH